MSLILEKITISLKRGKKLVDGLSLNVAKGEIFTVMGPSGTGKSTLLDAVGGNLSENFDLKGEVTLNNQDLLVLPPEKRNIGILYQDSILGFPIRILYQDSPLGFSTGILQRFYRILKRFFKYSIRFDCDSPRIL